MKKLLNTITYIVDRSTELKNKFTDKLPAPVEFVCIFCQNEKEYGQFTAAIETLGKIVETTPTGFTYFLDKKICTISGDLKLVKIRKPDINRPERGDADFKTNYPDLKKKYQNNPKFKLIERENFEMLRLSDPNFNVMTCFSDVPKSNNLNIPIVDIAGVFIKKDGKIIMVQEKKPSAYGLWNIPAGHVEKDETIENAAVREAKEETGYDIKLIEKIGIFPLSPTHQVHVFKAEIIDGKIDFDKDELLDVKWFSPDKILKLPLREKFILKLL